jgi:hypothetical protein
VLFDAAAQRQHVQPASAAVMAVMLPRSRIATPR